MQKELSPTTVILISLIISLGLLGCGFFISKGFYAARTNQPYITVKGLAERLVRADLAVWGITYASVGDDISTVNNELLHQQQLVIDFVKSQGFTDAEISLDQIKLTDRYATDYGTNKPPQRYYIKGGIKVRSQKVEQVKKASQMTGELIKQGVVFSAENEDSITNPAYYFTQLNAIRPNMISEATESAHKVAAQFAKDTHSYLGRVRRANQGIFEINSPDATGVSDSNNAWQLRREEQGSILKKIRLVSTIDYFLLK